MNILLAKPEDLDEVMDLYYQIIDQIKDQLYKPDWHRDVYPNRNSLNQFIQKKQLWIARENNKIIGAIVLNEEHNESYKKIDWNQDLQENEVLIIHLLGVHPEYTNKGIASSLIQFSKDIANQQNKKALRLDVYNRNINAERLYLNHGFHLVGSARQRYKETNWKYSNFFEFPIPLN